MCLHVWWWPNVSPHTLCISLPFAVSPAGSLSVSNEAWLPLSSFLCRRKRYCSSPTYPPPVHAVCFLSSLSFCSLIFFTFPSSRFNSHRYVALHGACCLYVELFCVWKGRQFVHRTQKICFSLVDDWLNWMNTCVQLWVCASWSCWQSEREERRTHIVLWYLPGVSDVINKVMWRLSFSSCLPQHARYLRTLCECVSIRICCFHLYCSTWDLQEIVFVYVCIYVCSCSCSFTTFITVESKHGD